MKLRTLSDRHKKANTAGSHAYVKSKKLLIDEAGDSSWGSWDAGKLVMETKLQLRARSFGTLLHSMVTIDYA